MNRQAVLSVSLTRMTGFLFLAGGLLAGCSSGEGAFVLDAAVEVRPEVAFDIDTAGVGAAPLWHSPDLLRDQTTVPPLDSVLRRHHPYPE